MLFDKHPKALMPTACRLSITGSAPPSESALQACTGYARAMCAAGLIADCRCFKALVAKTALGSSHAMLREI